MEKGCEYLAQSQNLEMLTKLKISGNAIKDEGLDSIANSPIFKNLVYLDISFNELGSSGAQILSIYG